MNRFGNSWQQQVDIKLDRILNDLDFVKNRSAVYLGRNEALTYLADETPIFVNTDDFGCPLNCINGGQYEEDNFSVLLSFRKPGLSMLDVGANLGIYSLRLAKYARKDNIYCFEPNPRIRKLLSRSVFLNGYNDRILIYPYAASDRESVAFLNVPAEHAGGASLEGAGGHALGLQVDVRRIDDLLPESCACGLIKLDVEDHELHALRGMRAILERSSNAVVMFEKLGQYSGTERELLDFFSGLGWSIYAIKGRKLIQTDYSLFAASNGYFIASLPSVVNEEGLSRDFFYIYPDDLNVIEGSVVAGMLQLDKPIHAGSVVFHGPYWSMPRGDYRITMTGKVNSDFALDICERFRYKVHVVEMGPEKMEAELAIHRDLVKFELVMRPVKDGNFNCSFGAIKIEKLG